MKIMHNIKDITVITKYNEAENIEILNINQLFFPIHLPIQKE